MTDSIHDDGDGIEVVGATFAILPDPVLYSDLSDRAVRLYAVLQRHAGLPKGAIPGRKNLAKKVGCSLSSLDRAIKELATHHFLRVEHRYRDGTRELTSSRYHLTVAGVVTGDSTYRHPRREVSSPVTQERDLPRETHSASSRSTRSRARRSSEGSSSTGGEEYDPLPEQEIRQRLEAARRDLRGK